MLKLIIELFGIWIAVVIAIAVGIKCGLTAYFNELSNDGKKNEMLK